MSHARRMALGPHKVLEEDMGNILAQGEWVLALAKTGPVEGEARDQVCRVLLVGWLERLGEVEEPAKQSECSGSMIVGMHQV